MAEEFTTHLKLIDSELEKVESLIKSAKTHGDIVEAQRQLDILRMFLREAAWLGGQKAFIVQCAKRLKIIHKLEGKMIDKYGNLPD